MGVMTGYHLFHPSVGVDFVVRPARSAKMPRAYSLYSYDDGAIHDFGGFGVLTDPLDLAKADYDFVILAMDGASLSGDQGRILLTRIGQAIRQRDTVLIVGSIGIGLRELAIAASGLPEDRVLSGRLGLLCHEISDVALPLHAPTDPALLARSDFAMRHLSDVCSPCGST
ncbi:hypothetical protein [Bordetella genomosp. 8]|nr:hypothetical protein [Bordetella genomosp. 8]